MLPKIVFCDNQILLAVKPTGWLTQPNETKTSNLETFCKEWVREKYKKPGNVYLHAVHRLDRPVSGLVLFARTSKALSRLNEEMRGRKIERHYLAEVEGHLAQSSGALEHLLTRKEHHTDVTDDGKVSKLTYTVVAKRAKTTLISIQLETGRTHQIRAQFSAIGHPIVGDVEYGSTSVAREGIALSCQKLAFFHPVSKEWMEFKVDSERNHSLRG